MRKCGSCGTDVTDPYQILDSFEEFSEVLCRDCEKNRTVEVIHC